MAKLLGDEIGKEFCRLLGISSDNVAKVDILLHANDIARVEVTRFLGSDEIGFMGQELEKYELVRKE